MTTMNLELSGVSCKDSVILLDRGLNQVYPPVYSSRIR